MILAPRNSDVDDLSNKLLSLMSGEEQVFHSADSIVQEAGANDETADPVNTFPVEFLRSLTASGLPPGELHLKPGCCENYAVVTLFFINFPYLLQDLLS